jgi:serine/threonine-protein kinase
MALAVGSRFGAYDVVAPLGAGGMGEVYRAKDIKLSRDVALKVLPASFTNDPERVARFRREAQVLASLNHPHIAQIYGLEEANGTQFLVLELVDGESLDKRIARGRIPVDEALGIAKQIAEALEAAHEKGIVHRDLKPANIALTSDGAVKVLDFGLAKAVEVTNASPDLSLSPTITTPAMMTGVGVILGTAAYMSPEQAKGRTADKRSDIWAFGCVLFEMLTGTHAFRGEDVSDTLAAVLRGEPDWSGLPKGLAPAVSTVLTHCLAKDRALRLADLSVVSFLLNERQSVAPPSVHRYRRVVYAVAAFVGLAVLLSAWFAVDRPAMSLPVLHLQTVPPPGTGFYINPFDDDIAVSPDGARIAFMGVRKVNGANPELFLRELNGVVAAPLVGTESARGIFFSPDGQWIGYAQNNDLKKISVHGGPAVTLCRGCTGGFRGASWGPNGTILFTAGGGTDGLRRISAEGGEPDIAVMPDPTTSLSYTSPEWLPDGNAVVFTAMAGTATNAEIVVRDMRTGQQRVLVKGGIHGRYVAGGFLVYAADGALRALRFDPKRLTTSTAPVPVVEHVVMKSTGVADFAITANGTLVYLSGDAGVVAGQTLFWVDRSGKEEAIPAPVRNYILPRLSPDGRRLALDVRDQDFDIWVWDFDRKQLQRFTFDPGIDEYPVWTPDGKRIAFGSGRTGARSAFWRLADGSGPEELLKKSTTNLAPSSVTADGKWLVAQSNNPTTGADIVLLSLDGARELKPLIQTRFNELNGEVSPDGHWIAYQSNESGRDEVLVRPFPNVDAGRWQISAGGGTRPLWSRDGHELFYISEPQGRLMSVPVRLGDRFDAGNPTVVVNNSLFRSAPQRTYDVSPDGRRFLTLRPVTAQADDKSPPPELNVVLNWVEDLKTKVPVK